MLYFKQLTENGRGLTPLRFYVKGSDPLHLSTQGYV